MAVTAEIVLMRGWVTLAIGITEAKLQQHKPDALRRGVHRVADADSLPCILWASAVPEQG